MTANTRRDGEDFLAEAARIRIRVSAVPYPMDRADDALQDLREDRVNGAAVLDRPERPIRTRRPTGLPNREKRLCNELKGDPKTRSADGAPADSRRNAVTGPLAIGPGALDWGTHAGSAIRR